mgnify:CR=1 FL=1
MPRTKGDGLRGFFWPRTKYAAGDTVGVGCFVDSCRTCRSCNDGLEQYCERFATMTYNGIDKDGTSIWVAERCGVNSCTDSVNVDPIMKFDANGNLVIRAGTTDIIQSAPIIYQERDGIRHTIAGRYVNAKRNEFAFSVADYDRTNALYIDPILTFSSFLGGNANTYAKAVAVDSASYRARSNRWSTGGLFWTARFWT